MAERKTGKQYTITYIVWCLDVVGGPPEDPDDDNEDWGYEVNDRRRCGEIEVEADETEYNVGTAHAFVSHHPTDEAIVQSLIDNGLFKSSVTPDMVDIDGESDEVLDLESTKDGEPLFQLEFESSVLVT
jgi:hypothetical protein